MNSSILYSAFDGIGDRIAKTIVMFMSNYGSPPGTGTSRIRSIASRSASPVLSMRSRGIWGPGILPNYATWVNWMTFF